MGNKGERKLNVSYRVKMVRLREVTVLVFAASVTMER